MAKKIDSNCVIGNAIILFEELNIPLTQENIYSFCNLVDSLLFNDYYTDMAFISSFCTEYPFFLKVVDGQLVINQEEDLKVLIVRMERHFRVGMPNKIIDIFYKAAIEIKNNLGVKTDFVDKNLENTNKKLIK